ncbi:MAG TPA: SpoIIE family protein phosphatase [Edaphobacter sp.]|jgi:serine phosphatase RsbU (regulator of sigma subunit)|nr:SpoIIE family protein phosphatase [Edaphobacter sp.]
MVSSPTEFASPASVPLRAHLGPLRGLDLKARYHSSRTGGDFFDVLSVGCHVVFLLTDIAGEWGEARGLAVEMQETFRRRVPELLGSPDRNVAEEVAKLTHEINLRLIQAAHGVHYAPTFLGCYDVTLGILTYVNAGGQTAVFRDREGTRVLGNISIPLGLFTHLTYEPAVQVFEPGARLMVVTKGILESRRGRSLFGVERVTRLLRSWKTDSADEICQAMVRAAHGFKGPSWYSLLHLHFGRQGVVEDMTALALVRPLDEA